MPTTPSYNCTQSELYSVANLGWASCNSNLAAFTAFSPAYIAAFIAANIAAIDAAEQLPDQEQREEDSKTLRIQLQNKNIECLDLWQRLKRYIVKAYPKDQQQVKLDAAGQQHYAKAANENWESSKRVMLDGHAFAAANTAALTANDNMPPTFVATLNTAKGELNTLVQDFFSAGQTDEVETQTKIEANNAVHAALMSMFLDGQEIFKNNEALKKLFTFEQVLLTVAGPGNTGFKGTAKNSITNLPVAGATLAVVGTDVEIITDEEGKFNKIIAAGTYSIIVTCPGFQDLQIPNIEIEPGVMKTLNITLTPLP